MDRSHVPGRNRNQFAIHSQLTTAFLLLMIQKDMLHGRYAALNLSVESTQGLLVIIFFRY